MTRELYSKEKCHPLKTFLLPWSQIPLWIVLSLAIRSLSGGYSTSSASGLYAMYLLIKHAHFSLDDGRDSCINRILY